MKKLRRKESHGKLKKQNIILNGHQNAKKYDNSSVQNNSRLKSIFFFVVFVFLKDDRPQVCMQLMPFWNKHLLRWNQKQRCYRSTWSWKESLIILQELFSLSFFIRSSLETTLDLVPYPFKIEASLQNSLLQHTFFFHQSLTFLSVWTLFMLTWVYCSVVESQQSCGWGSTSEWETGLVTFKRASHHEVRLHNKNTTTQHLCEQRSKYYAE